MQQHVSPVFTENSGAVLQPLVVLKALGVGQRMRIADLGAGHGHFALAAAQLVGDQGVVYAVDIQEPLVTALIHEAHARAFHDLYPLHGDATILGDTHISDAVIDMTFLINNHVNAATQRAMLQEAVRITKPLGNIIVIDWLGGNTVPFAPAITERVAKEDTMKNAASVGLDFVDEFRPGRYHYGLRFRK